MSQSDKAAAVPSSRLARLARLGSLASGVAGGMLAEGVRQWSRGNRPSVGDLLLTPGNAQRVANQLSRLRGAAMKVGQLLSMDAGDLMPPELAAILARLRADAQAMPMSQLVPVLEAAWGAGWDRHFERFSFTPLAAASIGQVHAAQLKSGERLAIKVQYPGVRQSIASDVDNVATLLRVSGLLPRTLDFAPLLEEAKRQLHDEADYLKEAAYLEGYRGRLADHGDFALPTVHRALTTPDILAMGFMDGVPIESLDAAPQAERDRVLGLLFELLFREIFEFRCVQTDPNFANYRYNEASGRLVLLDFGATRHFSAGCIEAYSRLLQAGQCGDLENLSAAAIEIGYFQADIAPDHQRQVLDIFQAACEPLRHEGPYDFGSSTLATRIRDVGLRLGRDRTFWHTPPVDALFLHRKIGGLYLLAARLKARVDIRAIFMRYVVSPAAVPGEEKS